MPCKQKCLLCFIYLLTFSCLYCSCKFVDFVDGFSSFQIVLDRQLVLAHFRWFQMVLDLFSSFQLVPHFNKYRSELLLLQVDTVCIKVLQLALKFLINIYCFDEQAWGCAFHFMKNFSKNELTIKIGFILIQKRLKYEISNPANKKYSKLKIKQQ